MRTYNTKRHINNKYANEMRKNKVIKNKSRRKLPIWRIFKVMTILVIFGLISFYSVKFSIDIYNRVISSDYFLINRIDISGNNNVTEEEILTASGVAVGQNNISISIEEVESALAKNPWLERVSVKRELPDILEIVVQERIPKFWILEGGVVYYADQQGQPIVPVGNVAVQSLPVLEIEKGGEIFCDRLPEMLSVFDRSGLPLSVQSASWLKLTRSGGLEIFLEESNLHLGLGADDFSNNLVRLSLVLRDLNRRGELSRARQISAYGNQVFVKLDKKRS